MKKLIPTVFLLLTATMLTGCVAANSGDSAPAPTQDAAIETVAEKTKPADVAATTTEPAEQEPAVDEANTAEGTDEAADQPVEDTMTFIVDITDNLIAESGKVIGNTTTAENYSGIIEIYLDTPLLEKARTDIQAGKTYLFSVTPMMTMSIPPQVTALDYTPATEEDIASLEEIRKNVSNFQDCMTAYETMSLDQMIQDANFNYALWTQEEIVKFQEFIKEKGYTEDSEVKSYVQTREELNGSVPGDAER